MVMVPTACQIGANLSATLCRRCDQVRNASGAAQLARNGNSTIESSHQIGERANEGHLTDFTFNVSLSVELFKSERLAGDDVALASAGVNDHVTVMTANGHQ